MVTRDPVDDPPGRSRLRQSAMNSGIFVATALITVPVVASIDILFRGGVTGYGDSPIAQVAGWALLTAPFVLLLGGGVALITIVVMQLLRVHSRALALGISVGIGSVGFALLAGTPAGEWNLGQLIRSSTMVLPLWIAFGLVVRIEETATS